jgi:hypothetical protein
MNMWCNCEKNLVKMLLNLVRRLEDNLIRIPPCLKTHQAGHDVQSSFVQSTLSTTALHRNLLNRQKSRDCDNTSVLHVCQDKRPLTFPLTLKFSPSESSSKQLGLGHFSATDSTTLPRFNFLVVWVDRNGRPLLSWDRISLQVLSHTRFRNRSPDSWWPVKNQKKTAYRLAWAKC